MGIGMGALVSGVIVRLIPNRFFNWVRLTEPKADTAGRSIVYAALRRDPTKQVANVNSALGGAFHMKS